MVAIEVLGKNRREDSICQKKGHSEEQIIAALKRHESGAKTTDICRQLGVSQATFYM
jgi:Transposase